MHSGLLVSPPPGVGVGPPTTSIGGLPQGAHEQVAAAIAALQEDGRGEAALGDAASHTRNIVVSEAAWALRELVLRTRDVARVAIDLGAVEAVIGALRQRPNSEAVQWKATAVLGQLVANSGQHCQTLAGKAGGVEVVVNALRTHPNSEQVQEHACEALGFLVAGGHQENRSLARAAGGVEVLVIALQHHLDNETLQGNAADALAGLLTGNPEAQARARRAKAVEALARTLQEHLHSETVEECASEALAGLVERNKENQKLATDVGAVGTVVAVLRQHRTSKKVQVKALMALRHLMVDFPEGQRLAMEAGSILVVLTALRSFPRDDPVQEQACEALTHLVSNNPANQRAAREAGLIEAVIQTVLARHPLGAAVQARALGALGSLAAGDPEGQRVAGEAGGVEAVTAGLKRPTEGGENVQEEAAVALERLARGNRENQAAALKEGTLEALIGALRQHPKQSSTHEKGCSALRTLIVDNQSNTKAAVAAGGIEEVIAALQLRPRRADQPLQRRAVPPLSVAVASSGAAPSSSSTAGPVAAVVSTAPPVSLTPHQEYQATARDAGLVEAIICALPQPSKPMALGPTGSATPGGGTIPRPKALHKDHSSGTAFGSSTHSLERPTYPSPQAALFAALADVVRGSYEIQNLASEAGGAEVVVYAMRAQPQAEEIQEHGALALARLVAENAACQRRAKAADAVEALYAARAAHPHCESLQQAVEQALEALLAGERFADRIMDTEYGRRHSTYTAIADTAMRGITLEQVIEFQEFIIQTLQKYDLVDAPDAATAATATASAPLRGHLLPHRSGGVGALAPRPRSVSWEMLTMYQVRDHFILPMTKQHLCSFAELIVPGKQPPMWMVSHWWGTPFPLTVRMLQLQARSRHLHAAASVTYWCDVFANNQRTLQKEFDEMDLLTFPFARAMLSQTCMGTILLCDPEVTALLRTWCVFEAHVTQQLRCGALADRCDKKRYFLDILAPVMQKGTSQSFQDQVTITMLQDAIGGSWNEVSDTEGVFFPLGVAHVGVGVDVLLAEASVESDRRTILNFLTQGVASKEPPPTSHPKYEELNGFVHNVFASAELYRLASEQPDSCVEAAAALLQLRADVNSFVRRGQTALFAAAGADPANSRERVVVANAGAQRDLVELLLSARADVNHASAEMKTVLDCASALSEDARGLLLEHGAKTFADAAPDLERSANAQLAQILSTGFASEQQAFIGGDAGTKLGPAAQRSIQASASILKLYHWAPCRIGMQTSLGRHQAQLAWERAINVRQALESAGCKNTFHVQCGAQVSLLTLLVSLAPPDAQFSPAAGGAGPLALPPPPAGPSGADRRLLGTPAPARPRSPQAVLTLRNPGRLPPVSAVADLRKAGQAFGSTWPGTAGAEQASSPSASPKGGGRPADAELRPRTGVDQRQDSMFASARSQVWSSSFPAGPMAWPSGAAAAALGRGAPPRTAAAGVSDRSLLPLSAPSLKATRIQPAGVGPGALQSSPRRVPTDLDSIAGDRWFQTSITCSRSAPALHTFTAAPTGEVKGLGSTSPFVGMELPGVRAAGPFPATTSPRGSGLPQVSASSASKGPRLDGEPGSSPSGSGTGRPQAASGRRPPLFTAVTPPSAATPADVANDGRPPTRAGQRPPGVGMGGSRAQVAPAEEPTAGGRRPVAGSTAITGPGAQAVRDQLGIGTGGPKLGLGRDAFAEPGFTGVPRENLGSLDLGMRSPGGRKPSLPSLGAQPSPGVPRSSKVFSVTDLMD